MLYGSIAFINFRASLMSRSSCHAALEISLSSHKTHTAANDLIFELSRYESAESAYHLSLRDPGHFSTPGCSSIFSFLANHQDRLDSLDYHEQTNTDSIHHSVLWDRS